MQYGNYEHLNANEEDEDGLNRTMQYGNGVRAKFDVKFEYCLNRTMQYGNLNTKRKK